MLRIRADRSNEEGESNRSEQSFRSATSRCARRPWRSSVDRQLVDGKEGDAARVGRIVDRVGVEETRLVELGEHPSRAGRLDDSVVAVREPEQVNCSARDEDGNPIT